MKFGAWLVVAIFLGTNFAIASTVKRVEQTTNKDSLKVVSSLGYVTLGTSGSESLKGLEVNIGLLAAFHSKFALHAYAGQALGLQSSFSTIYTLLAFGGVYSVTGSMNRRVDRYLVNDRLSIEASDSDDNGLRVGVYATQYFLNSSTQVIGLTGFIVDAWYEFLLTQKWNWSAGLRAGVASSGDVSLKPMQLYLSGSYRF
jgi:hypothetical protein